MANYKLQYSGAQIDTAIGKALNTNLNNYPTKTEVENKGYLTAEQVNALIDNKLSNVEPGGSSGINTMQLYLNGRSMHFDENEENLDPNHIPCCACLFGYTILNDSDVYTIMSGIDTSNTKDMSGMFQVNSGLRVFTPNFDTSNVINMDLMFEWCQTLEEITIDCDSLETAYGMFSECYYLRKVELRNVSEALIGNEEWFSGCHNLRVVDFRTATGVPTLNSCDAFIYADEEVTIVVPDDLYSLWVSATNWCAITNAIIYAASDYDRIYGGNS